MRSRSALLILLSVASGAVPGCNRTASLASVAQCATDSITSDSRAAYVDLECTGVRDTVTVTWDSAGGVVSPRVDLRWQHRDDHMVLSSEGLPDLVAFADLNGDGVRDIVLQTWDESTSLPGVVLAKPSGLSGVATRPAFDWPAFQYLFDGNVVAASCAPHLRPRVDSSSGLVMLVVPTGRSSRGDCNHPTIQRYRVRNDTLEPVGSPSTP